MNQELNNQVIKLIQNQQKIEAVKLVKDTLNWGLKESKEYVDALESGQTPQATPSNTQPTPSSDVIAQIKLLMGNGRKLEAVKLAYTQLNIGLAEAKEYVENLQWDDNSPQPSTSTNQLDASQGIDSEEFVQKIYHLLYKNQKIEAVKLVIDTYGLGLREAKEYVDKIERFMSQG
jgi:ribosomal protein L7/L12